MILFAFPEKSIKYEKNNLSKLYELSFNEGSLYLDIALKHFLIGKSFCLSHFYTINL